LRNQVEQVYAKAKQRKSGQGPADPTALHDMADQVLARWQSLHPPTPPITVEALAGLTKDNGTQRTTSAPGAEVAALTKAFAEAAGNQMMPEAERAKLLVALRDAIEREQQASASAKTLSVTPPATAPTLESILGQAVPGTPVPTYQGGQTREQETTALVTAATAAQEQSIAVKRAAIRKQAVGKVTRGGQHIGWAIADPTAPNGHRTVDFDGNPLD